jgi:hypothetical protein
VSEAPAKKYVSLATLAEGMPALTRAAGQSLAEAAAVCLELKEHSAGVCFGKAGLMTEDFYLLWSAATEQARRTYADIQVATEMGASAIALLFVKEQIGKVTVERSAKGTGFDYWLGDDTEDGIPFEGMARLEVSGILEGTHAQIQSRLAQKKRQMDPTDASAPGFVAIVEFGTPLAHLESK